MNLFLNQIEEIMNRGDANSSHLLQLSNKGNIEFLKHLMQCNFESSKQNTVMKILAISFSILFSVMCFESSAQSHQYSRKYRVVAYQNNNNQISSLSNEVEIIPTIGIYIPSAFTPNGDGINDQFGIGGEAVSEFHMIIFNRWGEKIFESNEVDRQWDGTFKGQLVQEGAYAYNVTAKANNGDAIVKKGHVTVIK
ncbi:MAG TPA: gliding motility-associated C-terminal domain-containing protein [Bacteroidia bacterium]|nr:gliding motility-associated C-terminal domain-containing protein [Bacteroidia bacterium]HNT80426.1 gliding motility-associated C-terminal domain-containing protein [Bacteroidia bacterium]